MLNWARVWLELPQAQVKSKFPLVDQILFVIGNLFASADFNIYIYIFCIKCSREEIWRKILINLVCSHMRESKEKRGSQFLFLFFM